MSHFNPNQHFDVESWRDRQIAQRTKDALAARDAAFAEKHADTPLRELALYLARCARTLRHSPAPCEVDGGTFIEERFGSWDAALRAACLPPTRTKAKLNGTARYRKERAIQEPLFLAERETTIYESYKEDHRISAGDGHGAEPCYNGFCGGGRQPYCCIHSRQDKCETWRKTHYNIYTCA